MTNREYIIENLKRRIDTLSDEDLIDYFDEFASCESNEEIWARKIASMCMTCPTSADECTGGNNCPITIKEFLDKEVSYTDL